MHAWEQIQLTIDYIEDHLPESMTVDQLASLASLSPFYYQRLFSRLVHRPVGDYIRQRRLARAAECLLQDHRRLLEVALDLGFSSHEHFTRSFKEAFGMTPEAYRKHPKVLNKVNKPELLLNYTLVDENVPLITDGMVLEIKRKTIHEPQFFTGLSALSPSSLIPQLGTESGPDPLDGLWRTFHQRKAMIPGQIPDADEVGITLPGPDPSVFRYFAGVQTQTAEVPEEWESWTLPAGEVIVCSFEAEDFNHLVMDALYKVHTYLFSVWLPGHQLASESFAMERYVRHDPDAGAMEIWVRPLPLSEVYGAGSDIEKL